MTRQLSVKVSKSTGGPHAGAWVPYLGTCSWSREGERGHVWITDGVPQVESDEGIQVPRYVCNSIHYDLADGWYISIYFRDMETP